MRLNNSMIKQVVVDPATIGDRLRLCGVRPYYEYIDGQRTNNRVGYTYTVTCSALHGERLDIKIPGKQMLSEEDYDSLLKFDGLRVGIYPGYVKGQRGIDSINLKATAESVSIIGN